MRQIITLLLTFVFPLTLLSDDLSPNEKQARSIFDKTYQMVFGPQGSTLSYSVNIIGIFKTNRASSPMRNMWRGTTGKSITGLRGRRRP